MREILVLRMWSEEICAIEHMYEVLLGYAKTKISHQALYALKVL